MPSYYSIIRYLPNPLNEEAINVGIAVFGGGTPPQFRFVSDWTRARQFGGESIEFLEQFAKQLTGAQLGIFAESSQWSEDRLRDVLGHWHNSIQFTAPRASLKEPAALLAEVSAAYLREADRRDARRGSRLHTEVRSIFTRMKLLARDPKELKNHRVVPDFPIDTKTGLYAEFALKNSSFHVLETIDYRGATPAATAKFYETGAKAFILDCARAKLGKRTKGYVIYSARPEDKAALKKQLALLDSRADYVLNYDNKKDLATLGSILKRATGARELPVDALQEHVAH